MGIVRLRGEDGVRLSSGTREWEGRLTSSGGRRASPWLVVVPAPAVNVVAGEGARHNAADRTRVRYVPPSEGEDSRAS